MSENKNSPLANLLSKKKNTQEYRRILRFVSLFEHFHLKHTVTEKVEGRQIRIQGKDVINFGSANYLGLEQHPAIIEASIRGLYALGAHSGCSRVFSSHHNIVALEQEISSLVGAESTMVGHNVSQIHAGVIPALWSGEDCVLFVDRFAHTSIFQASLMAKAKGSKVIRVDVSQIEKTRELMQDYPTSQKVLLIDGVYSMQGHIPPLADLDKLCREQGAVLYIDDAHGIGIFGDNGGGVVELTKISYENMLLVGSLQKGLGVYGAFISGPIGIIEFLRSSSKSYIFSGTIQPSAVEGSREAIRISRSEEGRKLRERLYAISRKIRGDLVQMGFQVPLNDSPIAPVLIGSDAMTLMAGRKMFDLGIFINSVVYPAVPRDEGILRISLTSLHTDDEVDALIGAFSELKVYLDKYNTTFSSYVHTTKEVLKSKVQGRGYVGL